jgi:hypothetical protein
MSTETMLYATTESTLVKIADCYALTALSCTDETHTALAKEMRSCSLAVIAF